MSHNSMVYLVLQEGGSSTETYLHAFETAAQADEFRIDCAKSAYRTTVPVPVSEELADNEEFQDVLLALVKGYQELDYADEEESVIDHAMTHQQPSPTAFKM